MLSFSVFRFDEDVMNSVLSSIFTVDVGGIPTVAFAAKNAREAQELGKEGWFLDDLRELRSEERPLWDGKAPLRIRIATQGEIDRYDEAAGEVSANSRVSGYTRYCHLR